MNFCIYKIKNLLNYFKWILWAIFHHFRKQFLCAIFSKSDVWFDNKNLTYSAQLIHCRAFLQQQERI